MATNGTGGKGTGKGAANGPGGKGAGKGAAKGRRGGSRKSGAAAPADAAPGARGSTAADGITGGGSGTATAARRRAIDPGAATGKNEKRPAASRRAKAGTGAGKRAASSSTSPAGGGKPRRQIWLKLLILALFAGALIAFFAFGGQKYLTLETIKSNRDALVGYTRDHYVLALAIAFIGYTIAVACSVPGAIVLSLTCGFLFGRWVGTLVILGAATLGATLVFLAARYLVADWARTKMGALGRKINEGFSANAFSYMLFLRLVPAFPFFLVNLAPAFTSIPVSTYVLATAIGIIPGAFVYANLGETLGTIDSLSGLISKETLIAFALLGVLSLSPIIVRKIKSGRARPA